MAQQQQQGASTDAIQLILQDHQKVDQLFEQFEQQGDQGAGAQKEQLAQQICKLLTVHTHLEEELFYPAARQAIGAHDLLDEATVEHASARDLIEQIQGMDASQELYDAKVTVLGEYVRHHVKEEETELIPMLQQQGGLDFKQLGQQMMARRQELLAEQGVQESAA